MMNDEEFAQAFLQAMGVLESETHTYEFIVQSGFTGKPRASSIAGCARAQAYAMTQEPETDVNTDKGYPHIEDSWPAWMGFAGQELAAATLRQMGYDLIEPDVFGECRNCFHPVQTEDECVLCENGCDEHEALMSAHVDGVISGLDLEVPHVWDSKLRNVFAYQKQLTHDEVKYADAEMHGQMQTYMRFTGLERTLITFHPHDLSTTRNQLTRRKEPIVTPTYVAFRRFIEANHDEQELLMQRAEGLVTATELGMEVRAEYDPTTTYFPCGWCPWKARCILANLEGGEMMEIPPITWGEDG